MALIALLALGGRAGAQLVSGGSSLGGGGGAATSVSPTAPANPVLGQLWFNSSDLQTYIWYSDGTSTQWTAIVNQFGSGGGSGGFTAGGDLSGNPTSQIVTGIQTKPVPAPVSGYLHYNGTAFVWDAPSGAGAPATNPPGGAGNYAPISNPTFTGTTTITNLTVSGTVSLPAGSITDTMLAGAYSGIGTCTAGQFVSALNRNAAPTCTTPAGGGFTAGGDLSGTGTSQTVIGIRSTSVPVPASGYLHFNGTAFVWDTPAGGGGGIPEAPTDGNVYFRQGSTASWQSGGTVVNDIIVSAVHLTNLSGWAPINFGNPNLTAGTGGAVTASLFAYSPGAGSNNNLNITAGSHMWNGNWVSDSATAEGIVLNPTSISFQYSTGNTVGSTLGTWNSIGSFSSTGLNLAAGRNYQVNGVNFGGSCAAGSAVTSLSSAVIPTCSAFASSSSPTFSGTTTITNLTVSGTVSLPAGSITDTMLASAYSGIGTCSAGQFVNALNRNAAPTCAAPPAGTLNNPTLTGTVTFPDTSTWTTAGITGVTNGTTNAGWIPVQSSNNLGFWHQGTPYLWGLVLSNTNPTGGMAWGIGTGDQFHGGLAGGGGLDIVDFGFQSVPVNPGGYTGPSGSTAVASFQYWGLQIGTNAAGANQYLDLGNVINSSVRFGVSTTPVGSLMGYAATNAFEITSGGYYDGTNWKASGTTFENIAMGSGHYYYYANTGLTAGSNVTPNQIGDLSAQGFNYVGVTNGTDAPAGMVGEFKSVIDTTVNPELGTTQNLTSLALGAGDWQIWGQTTFVANGTGINCGSMHIAVSTASAAFPTGAAAGAPGDYQQAIVGAIAAGSYTTTFATGVARVNSASAFTAYLVDNWNCSGTFAGPTFTNVIYARRMR